MIWNMMFFTSFLKSPDTVISRDRFFHIDIYMNQYVTFIPDQQYIEELLSYQIEGLIVLSHTLPSEKLASYQIPVIAIEREAEHISSVNTDNYMGALQATSLLIQDKCDILIHINVNVNKSTPAIWATCHTASLRDPLTQCITAIWEWC